MPTLHAYTNLMQIPTLVLGLDHKPIAPIDERSFFVSLDGGPKLRVTHARLEGDDKISLAILLDLSQTDPRIMEKVDDAIAALAPLSLNSRDEVAIYALDCKLVRAADNAPTNAAGLRRSVETALQSWRSYGRKRVPGDCKKPWHLLDSLAAITQVFYSQSGRRVILTVTDGADRGSLNSWHGVMEFAQQRSIAIFGLIQVKDMPANISTRYEDPFNSLCELSGGIVLPYNKNDIQKQFAWAITLVRGRYIVEFPRPDSTLGGSHNLDITIQKHWMFIRPTGISVPAVDPAILKNPTTVPSDPSLAPQFGKRKILTSQ